LARLFVFFSRSRIDRIFAPKFSRIDGGGFLTEDCQCLVNLIKFDRRRAYTLPGSGEVAIASPEDVIISKLVWRRESQSDKQWRDILGILKVQQEKLDFGYLREWVERFGLENDWQRAKVEAGVSHLE
jgi:hypothetical protein